VASAAASGGAWRSGKRLLAAQARVFSMDPSHWTPGADARVRVGVTAGKRHARRAVERVQVKRVLREAARHALAALDAAAGARRVDVVLRLRAARPAAAEMTRAQWRRALRAEADALLAQLEIHLRRGTCGATA